MESIGPYRVLNEVARGGMGAVYRVQDAEGRPFALKLLLDHDPDSVTRFQREAEIARSLLHPNVVPVHAYGVVRGRPYLVMEFVEGEDLMSRVERQGPLGEAEARRVFAQLGAGLAAAHAHGIVHRDLKPQNVLLRGGEVLLADFGLARQGASALTATGELLGTPAYMAPEQAIAERGGAGPAADVYGLGATLYAALSGAPPHRGATLYATLDLVLNAEPAPLRSLRPSDLSPELEGLVHDCLRKEPSERPDLESVLERLEASPGRPAKARGVLGVAALVAALALVTTGLWAFGREPGAASASPRVTSTAIPTAIPIGSSIGVPNASPSAGAPPSASPRPSRSEAAGLRRLKLAEADLALGDFPSAHANAGRALAADLQPPGARVRLIEVLLALGRFAELEKLAGSPRADAPPEELALYRFALARAMSSRSGDSPPQEIWAVWGEIEDLLRASLKAKPSARAYVWLGKVTFAAKRREEAERCLREARALDPREPSLVLLEHALNPAPGVLGTPSTFGRDLRSFEIGEQHLKYLLAEGSEDSPRVRALAERLREIRPHESNRVATVFAHASLGRAEGRGQRAELERALGHLDQALVGTVPGSVRQAALLADRGHCRLRLGRGWAEAVSDLEGAFAVTPTPRVRFGLVMGNQRLALEAIGTWHTDELERRLVASRGFLSDLAGAPEDLLFRQLCYEGHLAAHRLDFPKAEEIFTRCEERLAPEGTSPALLDDKVRTKLMQTYLARGRYRILARALGAPGASPVPSLERALELQPDYPPAKAWLAHACSELDRARARKLAEEILALGGRSTRAHGLVRILTASREDAWVAILEFLKIEPNNPRILAIAMNLDPKRVKPLLVAAPQCIRDHPLLLLTSSRVGRRARPFSAAWAERTEEALTRTLEAHPEFTWIRAERGLLRYERRDLAGARADVERAHRERPQPELGRLLEELSKGE